MRFGVHQAVAGLAYQRAVLQQRLALQYPTELAGELRTVRFDGGQQVDSHAVVLVAGTLAENDLADRVRGSKPRRAATRRDRKSAALLVRYPSGALGSRRRPMSVETLDHVRGNARSGAPMSCRLPWMRCQRMPEPVLFAS